MDNEFIGEWSLDDVLCVFQQLGVDLEGLDCSNFSLIDKSFVHIIMKAYYLGIDIGAVYGNDGAMDYVEGLENLLERCYTLMTQDAVWQSDASRVDDVLEEIESVLDEESIQEIKDGCR